MILTRIVGGPDGESRFENGPLTSALALQSHLVRLQPIPPGHTSPLHPEPSPTLATVLGGWTEITTSLGETRRFGPGHVMLFMDTVGKGHAFATAPQPTVLMIVRQRDGIAVPLTTFDQLPN